MLDPKKPGPLQPYWFFSIMMAHSDIRGSVSILPKDRIFSYSAGNPGMPSDIFEVDLKTKNVIGQLQYYMFQGSKGFEAKPFFAFGGDTYLGKKRPADPIPIQRPGEPDFLQFSY
jgi:hypothetical protein